MVLVFRYGAAVHSGALECDICHRYSWKVDGRVSLRAKLPEAAASGSASEPGGYERHETDGLRPPLPGACRTKTKIYIHLNFCKHEANQKLDNPNL